MLKTSMLSVLSTIRYWQRWEYISNTIILLSTIQEKQELETTLFCSDTNIAVLKLFPGIHENVVAATLTIDGLRAVVLETYGSGNAPSSNGSSACYVKQAHTRIVIVNVTQWCRNGGNGTI